jgi:hypothetical protein
VRTEIDMIGEIKDDYGVTVRNAKDEIALTFDAANAATATRRPIQYETGFTLLPGRYGIKILARDARTGRIGTFLQSFTVPNLEREHVRLRISSLVIATQRTARRDALFNVKETVASDVGNPLVQDGRKLIPSVTRTFRRSQNLFVFLQSYDSSMHPIVAFVAFYRDGGKAFESEPFTVTKRIRSPGRSRSSWPFRSRRSGPGHTNARSLSSIPTAVARRSGARRSPFNPGNWLAVDDDFL